MAAQLAAAGLTPKFADLVNMNRPKPQDNAPVSYTHLTLPTICSV